MIARDYQRAHAYVYLTANEVILNDSQSFKIPLVLIYNAQITPTFLIHFIFVSQLVVLNTKF
jgi:hypothetical protein